MSSTSVINLHHPASLMFELINSFFHLNFILLGIREFFFIPISFFLSYVLYCCVIFDQVYGNLYISLLFCLFCCFLEISKIWYFISQKNLLGKLPLICYICTCISKFSVFKDSNTRHGKHSTCFISQKILWRSDIFIFWMFYSCS